MFLDSSLETSLCKMDAYVFREQLGQWVLFHQWSLDFLPGTIGWVGNGTENLGMALRDDQKFAIVVAVRNCPDAFLKSLDEPYLVDLNEVTWLPEEKVCLSDNGFCLEEYLGFDPNLGGVSTSGEAHPMLSLILSDEVPSD